VSTANHWGVVQLPNGKVIARDQVKPVNELRWECPDPGHTGGFPKPGQCRICRRDMVQVEMMVRWTDA
jgi:hypothetical protein